MENSVARRMRLNAVGFTLNLGLALVQTLLPVYLKALGYSGATIGLVFTVNMALMALTSLPAGRLADAVGFRVPILLSGALYCLIGLAVLLLEHPLAVGMMAALMGVAVGLFRPAATALLSRLVQASRMGTAFAVFYTSCMIGAMSGSFMSGLLSDLYGFRPLFLLLAVTASLSLAMAPPSVRSTGGGSMATSEPPQP
ncbi:TPA: MFS transporter, partial [Candidatus Bathyarchaeota archaeon]|nr:MFS transporter [Candidatus Bathyarchaeota archaeon]